MWNWVESSVGFYLGVWTSSLTFGGLSEGDLQILDFEYSGDLDPAYDIANHFNARDPREPKELPSASAVWDVHRLKTW